MGWLWYPGLPPVLVSIAFSNFVFHISVFFHSLFTCHWISFVFLLYDRRSTHSIDPPLAGGEFHGSGLSLVPDVVIPEAGHETRMKQKSRFKFMPWPGFERQTLQSNGRKRYY